MFSEAVKCEVGHILLVALVNVTLGSVCPSDVSLSADFLSMQDLNRNNNNKHLNKADLCTPMLIRALET